MRAIKLIPNKKTKFMFGNSMTEEPVIFHSDSLASAILSNYFLFYPAKELSLEDFPRISSLFYGICVNGVDVFLLPFFRSDLTASLILEHSKRYDRKIGKRAKFISWNALKDILSGKSSLVFNRKIKSFLTTSENELLKDINFLYDYNYIQRNKISRKTSTVEESNLFGFPSLKLNDSIFFYFILEDNPDFDCAIKALLNSGIGGRKSVGFGIIDSINEIEGTFIEELNQMFNKNGQEYLSLSIVFLKNSDELKSAKSYQLYFSRGFIGHPVWGNRRKTVIGLKEGAVFNTKIDGKNFENVAPKGIAEKIVRIGKPLLLPLPKV